MNCPVCKTHELSISDLESGLAGELCEGCAGYWLSGRAYQSWLRAKGEILPEKPYDGPDLVIADTQTAKICPECRRIMLRYTVGHGTGFGLDQCGACFGVWLDKGEWEALKGRNLHDEINRVFTLSWLSEARKEERRSHLERIYARHFGGDYGEVKRIREWIDAHPERDRILAFLSDPDPFAV